MSYPKGVDTRSPEYLVVCARCFKPGGTLQRLEDIYLHPACLQLLADEVALELQQQARRALPRGREQWRQLEQWVRDAPAH